MENKKYDINMPSNPKSIIKVIGVGGGGSNAVNYMYNKGIKDVEFIVCNTDVQALNMSAVPAKLQIGTSLTEGLGAGANPEVGREAAIESREEIRELLSHGTKMLFITAGMGGGTGTGAAPIIAEIARELGILTVAIVTAPFTFEGRKKRQYADAGLNSLRDMCDTVLIISNDKLREIYGNLKMSEAFSQADNILATAAKGIAELITVPQYVNVDFEDVKTVMRNSGAAVMGSAKTEGESRALRAAQEALNSPLLNNKNIFGAKKILLSIMSGEKAELQMEELTQITEYIEEKVGMDAEMIFGTGMDASLGDSIRVTIIATGFNDLAPEEVEKKVNTNTPEVKPVEKPIVEEEPRSFVFEVHSKPSVVVEKVEKKEPEKVVFSLDDEIENKNEINPFEVKDEVSEIYLKKEKLAMQADERIEKLKKLSKSLDNAESFKEKIEIPAYLRRNVKLIETPHSSENEISRFNLNDENQILSNNKFFTDNTD
ncbi:MAG: cell division protein FtsZ [Microscillaceae bacterium]|jgi:cell division protein FtsZ|nr:cell division protein FtsZ [Microscillaceae bacterium]